MNATETWYDRVEQEQRRRVLQWGRRVNATETQRWSEDRRREREASMGPSRECDGDAVEGPGTRPGVRASMGPSRECDGDPRRRRRSPTPQQSFNGAVA